MKPIGKPIFVSFLALMISAWLAAWYILLPMGVSAQGILPSGPDTTTANGCEHYFTNYKGAFENADEFKTTLAALRQLGGGANDLLGCAIKSGQIHLYMMPYFIVYLTEYLLGLAGIIAVLFIVYGGYQYVVGGITEDKESGKKTITHALIGLLLALGSWIIVNYVQIALTS